MAYTVPSSRLIRSWKAGKRRYGVHRAQMIVGGADGAGGTHATTTATKNLNTPPGRIVGVQYGIVTAPETWAAATTGALTTKAESTAGAQIFTDADLTSIVDGFLPVGTTSGDEGTAATAATDGFSGGFPIRGGIFSSIATGTDLEVITVDYLVRYCTYARVDVIATTGADGTGAGSYTLNLGGPGVLSAVAVDFQNTPATADLTITADDASGEALVTRTSSQTDFGPMLIGRPGADEAAAASAATDGTESANGFKSKLIIAVAESDIFTSSDEKIIVELWIDD